MDSMLANSLSRHAIGRFIITSLIVWPMLGVYLWINQHQPSPPQVVQMPTWMPFWPITIVLYWGLLLVT